MAATSGKLESRLLILCLLYDLFHGKAVFENTVFKSGPSFCKRAHFDTVLQHVGRANAGEVKQKPLLFSKRPNKLKNSRYIVWCLCVCGGVCVCVKRYP